MKIFRNIFRITFIMFLLFAFYNNLEAMGAQKIKTGKLRSRKHNQRLIELVEERRLDLAKFQAETSIKIIKSEFAAGEEFYYGNNVQKDYKQALEYFSNIVEISKTQAVDKTILLLAYHYIGVIYFFGDEKIKKDRIKAFNIFNDIVTTIGAGFYEIPTYIILIYIDSVYRIGFMFYCEKKYEQALKYFQIILDVPGIHNLCPNIYLDIKRILGIMCFCGYGVEQNVLKAELCFFEVIRSVDAEKINSEAFHSAQSYLKIMYFNELDAVDELVTFHYKNIVNAIDAQKINTIDWIKAHYFFASSYWHGFNNFCQNTTKALIHSFAIIAADDAQKNAPEMFLMAHYFFGKAYCCGDGVKQNEQRAKIIFNKIINMPNSLTINSLAWFEAKEFLGETDDMDSVDWWIERLSN